MALRVAVFVESATVKEMLAVERIWPEDKSLTVNV
jgi:hypothetical protein